MTDIAIRFEGAGKTYPDGTTAVEALDLEIPRGSLTVFVCLLYTSPSPRDS